MHPTTVCGIKYSLDKAALSSTYVTNCDMDVVSHMKHQAERFRKRRSKKNKWFCQYRLRSRQIDILYRFSRIFKQIALDKIESSDFGVGFEPRPRCSSRTYDYNSIINHFCSVFPLIQGTCMCFVVGTKHMHVPWMCRHKWGEAKQQWFVIKL